MAGRGQRPGATGKVVTRVVVRKNQCFHRWTKNHRCIKCNTVDPTKNPEGISKRGGVIDGTVPAN